MTQRKNGLAAFGLAAALLCLTGCKGAKNRPVNVVGSTSVQPFAEVLAQEYEKRNPAERVEVQGGGSTAGLQAAVNGLADIGMCSRSLNEAEAGQFTPITIARDGLAIVVNPANTVDGLSLEQLRGIFSGRIANWEAVGGKGSPIRLIAREEGSGTRESFMHLVMDKDRIPAGAIAQESNGAVKELVKGDPAAIGFMSLGLVGKELKALAIDGAEPTHENVLNGKYKLARPFLFAVKGAPGAGAQKFIDFVLSADAQKMLEDEGLIRAK
ncbi:MAG TPA: phosphate ABC transporter substrate-binding protein [Candidatus Brocadiia bacterium]|nr:phosphate ABC transporter substrate-binding protein [Candidatus Brocadiia bacterium]